MSDDSLEARLQARKAEAAQQADQERNAIQARATQLAQQEAAARRHIDEFRKIMRDNGIDPVPVYVLSYKRHGFADSRNMDSRPLGIAGWRLADNPLNHEGQLWPGRADPALLEDGRLIYAQVSITYQRPKRQGWGRRPPSQEVRVLWTRDPVEFLPLHDSGCIDVDYMANAIEQCLKARSGAWGKIW